MRLIDVSRVLHSDAPHWPGDTPTDFRLTARMAEGSSCNVGALALSVHNGTHVDAPFHYDEHGATIDAVSLERFVGPARVIDARGQPTLGENLFARISRTELTATPRILFRTDVWLEPAKFPANWPRWDPALPAWLGRNGVTLVGVDFPSVDELTSQDLPVHHALKAAGILILENLLLRDAEPGVYELLALPLKIRGGDASPVRAVLRTSG